MKTFPRLIGIILVAGLASLAGLSSASAAIITCQGIGSTTLGSANLQYGTCRTDQNDGTGSVRFAKDGLTVTLDARTKQGSEQVAADWQSNGAVADGTTRICVDVDVTALSLHGGSVQQTLKLSYNGSPQMGSVWAVTATGAQPAYCASVPAGASNIWWQLITTANADGPSSHARVRQTLTGVSSQ